ncbi:hemolysin-III related family protein [Trichomonas vaginalis G3]|uniref:Haemolysin-III related family protein n=1 Tax=Trichomonas vaginalis (strain ATCC PRA-98 / G3) TaxID=412133 RepID=A2EJL3_TRIV3|nr:cytolysis [Trichomonas vaginalis G3]EAY07183.1 hemolysin-III related family protein [Trichomonas vaginalis G3]KAI5503633.1 cytolysis [Trichomonas vaginalis G3]|eukprot:XP_001319406.1 Haemolysin-III related family protein [Trichomonas vaginalis G3]
MKSLPDRSHREELANCITHAIMIPVGIAITSYLVYCRWEFDDPIGKFGLIIFGITFSLMMLNSSVYHYASDLFWKRFFRYIDHFSIFIQITGAFTPCVLLCAKNIYGYGILAYLVTFTIIGIISKYFFFDKVFGGFVYLTMGWSTILIYQKIKSYFATQELLWFLYAGICYSIGAAFYALQKSREFMHTVFHLFTDIGALCHFYCLYMMNIRTMQEVPI